MIELDDLMPEFTFKLSIKEENFVIDGEITVRGHCREDAKLSAEMAFQELGRSFNYKWLD